MGGFSRADVDAFYARIDTFDAWSSDLAVSMVGPSPLTLREILERVRRVNPQVAQVVSRAIVDSDCRTLLPRCAHPVLLHSDADNMVPPSVEGHLRRTLPDARLVRIPGVGHIPHRTQPQAFNDALATFVCEAPAQRALIPD